MDFHIALYQQFNHACFSYLNSCITVRLPYNLNIFATFLWMNNRLYECPWSKKSFTILYIQKRVFTMIQSIISFFPKRNSWHYLYWSSCLYIYTHSIIKDSRRLLQAWMPNYQGDPCASGHCTGMYSTGTAAPGPTLARSLPAWRNHETSQKRSAAQKRTKRIIFSEHLLTCYSGIQTQTI